MNIKGSIDFMPNEMNLRNKITDTLKKNFIKYGYLPIETSLLNYYELLSYKYQDDAEILSEIYKLTDQGDRKLGLRYDLTVPFCKVVAMNKNLKLPFRRYEIGKVFRNGPVKMGRAREFYQCDVDVVGIDNRYIEAEQIYMAINIYKELGIDIIVKYNNRKLMSGLIKLSNIPDEKVDSIIGIIDKMEKVSEQELLDMLTKEIQLSSAKNLLDLFKKDITYYKEISNKNELLQSGVEEILELNKYISQLEIDDKCIFTPTLARGLSIYTGVVFEFYDKLQRLTCAIGAGGRYNKIITNFIDNGNNYPAIGLSFGLEPIYEILKQQQDIKNPIDIYIVPMDTEIESLKLATELRKKDFNVLIEMNKKKIFKCFEYADNQNIKYIMIIGSNEIKNKVYKIKNMIEKIEYTLTFEELIKYLEENR